MQRNIIIIILANIFLFSCAPKKTINLKEKKAKEIHSQIVIDSNNLFLNPISINYKDNKLFVIEDTKEGFIKIINLENNKIQTYGQTGQGPNDFPRTPDFIQTPIDEDIQLYASNKIYEYNKKNDIFSFKGNLTNSTVFPMNNIIKAGNKFHASITGEGRLYTYPSSPNLQPIKQAFFEDYSNENIKGDISLLYKAYLGANYKSELFVVAYERFNIIEIYNFDGELQTSIDFSEKSQIGYSNGNIDLSQGYLYNISLSANDDYFYALYLGVKDQYANENIDKINFYVNKFNWNGELVQVYKLDEIATSIAVDNNSSNVYYINPMEYNNPIRKASLL